LLAHHHRHRYVPSPQDFGYGYNAATAEYGDLFAMGVIDPAKVTINAIENSASVASLVLTTEALITELPEKKEGALLEEAKRYDAMRANGGSPYGGYQGYQA
jgi:chaperonin GroEL